MELDTWNMRCMDIGEHIGPGWRKASGPELRRRKADVVKERQRSEGQGARQRRASKRPAAHNRPRRNALRRRDKEQSMAGAGLRAVPTAMHVLASCVLASLLPNG